MEQKIISSDKRLAHACGEIKNRNLKFFKQNHINSKILERGAEGRGVKCENILTRIFVV